MLRRRCYGKQSTRCVLFPDKTLLEVFVRNNSLFNSTKKSTADYHLIFTSKSPWIRSLSLFLPKCDTSLTFP